MGWIGSEAKPAVPLLIQELKMADWDLRRASITALSRIGPEAKSALPDMIEVLGIFVNSAAEQDKADMQERPAVKSSGNRSPLRTKAVEAGAVGPETTTSCHAFLHGVAAVENAGRRLRFAGGNH